MPGFVGLPEIILFGIVALLIFGPKKLPEMGRSLGKGMREFKDSVSGSSHKDEIEADASSPLARMQAADVESNPFADVAAAPSTNGEPVRAAR